MLRKHVLHCVEQFNGLNHLLNLLVRRIEISKMEHENGLFRGELSIHILVESLILLEKFLDPSEY